VSFFDRFKKKDNNYEIFTRDIPLSTILRWYIYDTELGEPNDVVEVMGLNRASEEGDEKEREDSEMRLDNIGYLMPYLDSMAEIAADVITAVQVDEITKDNPDNVEEIEREIGTMRVLYKIVSLSAIMGAFASAMEIGLIEPGDIQKTEWENRVLDEQ
jgi:hypothetical protein